MNLRRVEGYISKTAVIDGDEVSWTHLYVTYPAEDVTGLAVMVCKCVDADVIDGVRPGDYAELYYDEKKKVVLVQPVVPTQEDLLAFGVADGSAVFVEDEDVKPAEKPKDAKKTDKGV